MSDLFLVDTSAWVEALSSRPSSESLRQRVRTLAASDLVATIGMVRYELIAGTRNDKERDELSEVVLGLHQLAIPDDAWDNAASRHYQLRRQGLTLPPNDILIATVAIEADVTLLHRDRHFDVLAQHTPLRVESYVTSP